MANNDYLENLELIDTLDRAALAALLAKAKHLEGQLLARLLIEDHHHASQPDGDRLLTCDETAALLSVTKQWLYRRGKRLGFAVRLGDGTLRFSNGAIQGFIRANRRTRK